MTNTLQPSSKIRALCRRLYDIKDKRLINDKLKEIERETTALEVQAEELRLANENLLMENVGVAETKTALRGLCEYFEADYDRPPEYHAGVAALAAPNVEVPF